MRSTAIIPGSFKQPIRYEPCHTNLTDGCSTWFSSLINVSGTHIHLPSTYGVRFSLYPSLSDMRLNHSNDESDKNGKRKTSWRSPKSIKSRMKMVGSPTHLFRRRWRRQPAMLRPWFVQVMHVHILGTVRLLVLNIYDSLSTQRPKWAWIYCEFRERII